jgi:L-iditol 2-dehydrogenase
MLAAVYHGPNDLRVEDVPMFLRIGPGELLIQVKSASICGTDLRIFHGNHRMYAPGTNSYSWA